MMTAPFLDTNILVYAASHDPRSEMARAIVQNHFIISVQCLNEFANVARRKLLMSWEEIGEISALYRDIADEVVALDTDLHVTALGLASRYGYSLYDASILAAAIKAGCKVLYSEDMQSGQILDEGIEITNPFAPLR
ncbi:MAG TPA: PIN domain-containing protein [Ensifer sp.]|nr:PIN domain-containing protein [Ensifer sp.]